ncbi:hypothetical protein BJX99DRAFT_32332 [Aspergillus californicus]
MADAGFLAPTRQPKRESQRSRKGCPDCRSRKIKCDERKPECGQCLKSGRLCRILDSIFKPHSYTFSVASANQEPSRSNLSPEKGEINGTSGFSTHFESTATESAPTNTSEQVRVFSHRISSQEGPAVNQCEDSYQDRCEIAFFLRHFSEGPAKWMDICGGQSYFSQQTVALSHWSPLVRYAACALAAKQLGQIRRPQCHIRQTNTQTLMLKALTDTKLGFTWYGAKYYEKAIQLLAKQISSKDRTSFSLSPNCIYDVGLGSEGADYSEYDRECAPFQVIAACILCQYEDVNATIRAWSGHLDGLHRLLGPYLSSTAAFKMSTKIIQPMRAMDSVFWFFVLHDMMNAFVTRQKTRIDPEDYSIWRNMSLLIDEDGRVSSDAFQVQADVVSFKALVRLMCQLVNSDLSNAIQWTKMNDEFNVWQNTSPSSSYIPITWPLSVGPQQSTDVFSREIWFPSDLNAITMGFYHMARIILLTSRPMSLIICDSQTEDDLLHTCNALQHDLRQHAMEIIPIMHAMPSETVRKYMLQPLYVAGRCLTDDHERRSLLQILRDMCDDFGLFTDYRIKELCEEWGMPNDGIDRKDGHGIIT